MRFIKYFLSAVFLLYASTDSFAFPSVSLTAVADGFSSPTHIASAGDGAGRLFVVEQGGKVKIVSGGKVLLLPFIDISDRISTGSERGLLSIAFPPSYASRGWFYLDYTRASDGATVVSRFRITTDPNIADSSSEEILLVVEQPFENHNGGQLAFGPDGYLYIGMGDGGSAGDPYGYAQNLGELSGNKKLLGKLLRIDVESGASPYAIPSDNPILGGSRSEIWSMGFRNPWRFSFDRATGDLYIGDVGQDKTEEIDFQSSTSTGGENYGWNILEGSNCCNPPESCIAPVNYSAPIAQYDHGENDSLGCSVTGGFVYRGSGFSEMHGVYFYGDFCTGSIYGLRWNGSAWESGLIKKTGLSISTFGEGEDGALYVADYAAGTIYRIDESSETSEGVSDGSTVVISGGGGCFVVVAACGSYLEKHVYALRNFRDKILMKNSAGVYLVELYYRISPSIAGFLQKHPSARTMARWALTPAAYTAAYPRAAACAWAGVVLGGVVALRRRRALPQH